MTDVPNTLRPAEVRPGHFGLALLIAVVMTVSAVSKVVDPASTTEVMSQVWTLPQPTAIVATLALAVVEGVIALLVLLPRTRRFGIALTACFLITVSASPAVQLLTNSTLDCGCSFAGLSPRLGQAVALLRNAILISLCCRSELVPHTTSFTKETSCSTPVSERPA